MLAAASKIFKFLPQSFLCDGQGELSFKQTGLARSITALKKKNCSIF